MKKKTYTLLHEKIDKVIRQHNVPKEQIIFYYATAPLFFAPISTALHKEKLLCKGKEWPKVMCEKPFGTSKAHAQKINTQLSKLVNESQMYRIDHYLGKTSVQNILTFRFANNLFSDAWTGHHIDHIQIVFTETLGVEERAGYYDKAGAIRDMLQNHILQLLASVTMDAPKKVTSNDIKKNKVAILKKINKTQLAKKENIVLGQYTKKGQYKGYTQEKGVKRKSKTETFIAAKLFINNSRWKNVPIYIMTGKRLKEKQGFIYVEFKERYNNPYKEFISGKAPNSLTIHIQPKEGIEVQLLAKTPQHDLELNNVNMAFCYDCLFTNATPKAYEELFLDCIEGQKNGFTSWEEAKIMWEIADLVEKSHRGKKIKTYDAGSIGPLAAKGLIESDDRQWQHIKENK